MPDSARQLDLLTDLVARAKRAGADAADAVLVAATALSHGCRLGKTEDLQRAESEDLGLRVFFGKRQAVAATTDFSATALAELVERAVAMAREVPEDAYSGLAPEESLARDIPSLDGADPSEPSAALLFERAKAAEDAALAVKGVTNSEGAGASWSRSRIALAASNGFAGDYAATRHSVSASVIAGTGTAMERDYDYSTTVHAGDLESPEAVGRRAGERAVKRLGARKAASATVPVVYDPRLSRGIVSHLADAINGNAIARGTSFLKDSMGKKVFAPGIGMIDDPHRKRGLRSSPFDGEGVARKRRDIIADGVLTSWILDWRSARQLGLASTGHAARGTAGPPSPSASNLYLAPGSLSPAELMADIKQGLYATELLGFGVNYITGDYSRGASGFWIENGVIAYPVSEITIAGNLKDMFARLVPANDLHFRYGIDAPTLRIDGMTVAGR